MDLRPIPDLERHVMKALGLVADEIDGVMLDPAPHEHEVVADPVGDAKPQEFLIESRDFRDIVNARGDMADLQRIDAPFGFVARMETIVRIHLDQGAFGVGKNECIGDAGRDVRAPFAGDAGRIEGAGGRSEVATGRHLEGDALEIGMVAFLEHDRLLAKPAYENGLPRIAFGHGQAHDASPVVHLPFEIGRREGRVGEALDVDHRGPLPSRCRSRRTVCRGPRTFDRLPHARACGPVSDQSLVGRGPQPVHRSRSSVTAGTPAYYLFEGGLQLED